MIISLIEYAKIIGIESSAVRRKAISGQLTTARKIGRNWVVDSYEAYPDNRVTDGKYKNWRKQGK